VRAIAAAHREELHRAHLELGNLEAHEQTRRRRLGDHVLGQPAPSHPGEDHVPLRGDVGDGPARSSLEHVQRRRRGVVRAVPEHDLRVSAQQARWNRLPAGRERVIAVRDGMDAHAAEVDALELRSADTERGRDRDLGALLAQRVGRPRQALGRELDAHGGEALLRGAQDLQDRLDGSHRLDREPHHRLDPAAELAAEAAERLGLLDHRLGALEEEPPGIGERGAIAAAVEQLDAELVLEISHQLAQRRLRLVQRRRGRAEAARVGDGEEGDELVVGHPRIQNQ
jgi:hypothetical protein